MIQRHRDAFPFSDHPTDQQEKDGPGVAKKHFVEELWVHIEIPANKMVQLMRRI